MNYEQYNSNRLIIEFKTQVVYLKYLGDYIHLGLDLQVGHSNSVTTMVSGKKSNPSFLPKSLKSKKTWAHF